MFFDGYYPCFLENFRKCKEKAAFFILLGVKNNGERRIFAVSMRDLRRFVLPGGQRRGPPGGTFTSSLKVR